MSSAHTTSVLSTACRCIARSNSTRKINPMMAHYSNSGSRSTCPHLRGNATGSSSTQHAPSSTFVAPYCLLRASLFRQFLKVGSPRRGSNEKKKYKSKIPNIQKINRMSKNFVVGWLTSCDSFTKYVYADSRVHSNFHPTSHSDITTSHSCSAA